MGVVDETRSAVAHLLRRAGFGGTAAEIDAYADLGYEGAVDALCDGLGAVDAAAEAVPVPALEAALRPDPDASPAERQAAQARLRQQGQELILWWLRRMVVAEQPLREKLTFWWHDHFATSLAKVRVPALLLRQYRTLYDLGPGRFDALVSAVARDPAMLVWLDGRTSTSRAPNENFARELFELFTLGHGGGHADQPYTEDDVAEAARALTGWVIDPDALAGTFVARRHDAGTKTVLGRTGPLGLDDVVAAATAHPACAPHVVAALWSRLARPAGIDDPVVIELAAAFAAELDVAALLRRCFLHPEFLAEGTRSVLVKTPVELVAGALRALELQPDLRHLGLLRSLGQVPFFAPDVDGWPANEAWLSTSSAHARLQLATLLADVADVADLEDAAASQRPDVAARRLGVDVWGAATTAALDGATATPGPCSPSPSPRPSTSCTEELLVDLSRRHFLHGAGVLGAATAVGACRDDGPSSAPTPSSTTPPTSTAPRTDAGGTLVVVTLYGGNDALNTVVPVGDPQYATGRGALALDPTATHDVGEGFALHPALAATKAAWDEGRVAVVHGVGFAGLDRSHFHCMDVWQAGSEHDRSTGWIGRWLDAVGSDPLDAVAVGNRLPLLGRGAARSAAVVPVGPLELPGDAALRAGLVSLTAADAARAPLAATVAGSTADLLDVVDVLAPILAGTPAAEPGLTAQLDVVATLLDAGLPTRVYAADLGGFDTHSAQAGTHEGLLAELDAALDAFLTRIGDRAVTVVVHSEFGRRVAPNGSDGTDHGGAGTVLLAGGVRAGHHGEPPPLDRLDDGDLATTVDFRAVYGGLLEGVLGIDAADILGADTPTPLDLV